MSETNGSTLQCEPCEISSDYPLIQDEMRTRIYGYAAEYGLRIGQDKYFDEGDSPKLFDGGSYFGTQLVEGRFNDYIRLFSDQFSVTIFASQQRRLRGQFFADGNEYNGRVFWIGVRLGKGFNPKILHENETSASEAERVLLTTIKELSTFNLSSAGAGQNLQYLEILKYVSKA